MDNNSEQSLFSMWMKTKGEGSTGNTSNQTEVKTENNNNNNNNNNEPKTFDFTNNSGNLNLQDSHTSVMSILTGGQKPAAAKQEKKESTEAYSDLVQKEKTAKLIYEALRNTRGLDNEDTLNAALNLCDQWIGFYFLKDCDDLLSEIFDLCVKRGGAFEIKAVQSRAFLRFKQFRYKESLELMLRQRELVGPCVELCENIGHVYNSLHMTDLAEKEFRDGLDLLKQHGLENTAKTGGLMLGISQILGEKGKIDEQIEYLNKAKNAYLKAFSQHHSLIAKTTMYLGQAYEKKGDIKTAETYFREAVKLFLITCGENTPLTATAWKNHAEALLLLGQKQEAETLMKKAIHYEVTFNPLRLFTVYDLFNKLLALQVAKPSIEEKRSKDLIPYAKQACQACKEQFKTPDGNVGVLYKLCAEIMLLGYDTEMAPQLLLDAVGILQTVKEMNVSHLVEECMLLYMQVAQKKSG